MTTATCLNKGCGKPFDSLNLDGCQYHPGGPVFHDALKGWSCCEKKVVDFDSFLKIPGCTKGKHSSVVASKPTEPKAEPVVAPLPTKAVQVAAKVDNLTESFKSSEITKPKEQAKKTPESELHDSKDAVIEVGMKCKRPACGFSYENESSRTVECIHHPGVPVFHEGTKGWSCCPKKVIDFDEFLKMKGCVTGLHRFTDPKPIGPVIFLIGGC